MKFTKMHGCGNDYVYINCFEETVNNSVDLAIKVSHRHYGIGSDGLILIKPNNEADAEMEMYNADGSMSEMCGNGLRCVAKFVYDHGIAPKKKMRLMTGDGIKEVTVIPNEKDPSRAEAIRIDMGQPRLDGPSIPSNYHEKEIIERDIIVDDTTFQCTLVNVGNPHCIIYVDDVKNFPVEHYGPLLESHKSFPARINVEFVEILSSREVIQRTWERGSGETWACGTGATAVSIAGVLTGKTDNEVLVHLTGGDLILNYEKGSSAIMTGPAVEIFSGTI